MGGFTGICATIPGKENGFNGNTIGANMFITYSPTNSYVVDSSAPSQQFKFVSYKLPDGTLCYYRYHAPWSVKYQTNLPSIGGYQSTAINVGTWVNILLNAYYR